MPFSVISDYTPTGGPISAAANPGSISNGFVDYNGYAWAVDASNNLITTSSGTNQRPYLSNMLVRSGASESLADSQWTVRFTNQVQTNSSLEFYFRIINLGATQSSYTFNSNSGTGMNISTTIGGGFPSGINGATSTGSFARTAGTQYDLTMSCVQTNATTTTLQATLFTTTGTQLGQLTVTDTTASLQNVAGYTGVAVNNNNAGTLYTFQRVRAYSDAPATSYSITLATSVTPFNSYTGKIPLIGGAVLSSPLVVTLAASGGGTFIGNPVTLNTASIGTFTYIAQAIGTETITATYTGGNAGMTNPASFTVTAAVTFYPISSYTIQQAPVNALPAPGAIGNGWTDVAGNNWSLNQNCYLDGPVPGTPWNNAPFARIGVLDLAVNSKVQSYLNLNNSIDTVVAAAITAGSNVVTPTSMRGINNGQSFAVDIGGLIEYVTPYSTTATTFTATFANAHAAGTRLRGRYTKDMVHMHRYTSAAGITSCYAIGYNFVTGFYMYPVVSGTRGTVQFATGSNPAAYEQVIFTTQCTQTASGTTTITTSVADQTAPGTILATATFTDTAASLQNVNGYVGLYYDNNGSNATPITRIDTFSGSPLPLATGISYAYPNYVIAGATYAIQANLVGGYGLPSNLVLTFSDGASGVFSPSTLTITTGTPISTVNYTPAAGASGSKTVTVTTTSGGAGMTFPSNPFITIQTTLIGTNSSSCFLSPWGWRQGNGGASTSKTWQNGAYAYFFVKGTSQAAIYFDSTFFNGTQASVSYEIDDGVPSTPVFVSGAGVIPVNLGSTGSHKIRVFVNFITEAFGRWTGTTYCGLNGIGLNSGGTADPTSYAIGSKRLYIVGDSITEGYNAFTSPGNTLTNPLCDIRYSFAYLVGESLRALGYEYGVQAIGGLPYTFYGGAGGVPPMWDPANTFMMWDKIDSTTSKLDVSGKFSPQADIILDALGVNDALYGETGGALTPTLSSRVTSLYRALRGANPSALLVNLIPFSGRGRADYVSAMTAFAATPDSHNVTIDLHKDVFEAYYGGLHPNVYGHAVYGSLITGSLFQQPIAQGSSNAIGSLLPSFFRNFF